jgi:hypothetical protein
MDTAAAAKANETGGEHHGDAMRAFAMQESVAGLAFRTGLLRHSKTGGVGSLLYLVRSKVL